MLLAHLSPDQRAILEKWMDEDNKVKCNILAFMSNDLQRQYEDMRTAREMLYLYFSQFHHSWANMIDSFLYRAKYLFAHF